ncbi:MAG: Npun_R2821/Npun_R2822 family protein [Limnoraphis sp.]
MKQGICTLGNDIVYDQLVALLNSIDTILGSETPVCIYPFDDQLEKIKAEVEKRPNVFIYEDTDSIQRWDEFMAVASPASVKRNYRIYGGHRRFCAFDGPFDRFVYLDADTLVMNSLDRVFDALENYDCVTYDFQHLDPKMIYNVESPLLFKVFSPEQVRLEIFCSGFFASKKGLFPSQQREWLLSQLKNSESEILYPTGDQPVLNYIFMRSKLPIYNLAHHLPNSEKTGNSVTSSHFEAQDHILYDKGKRLTYLHYIGIAPRVMQAVCRGENIEFPYRDIFLHYRYLHKPEKRPVFTSPGVPYNYSPKPSLFKRVLRKLKLLSKKS